MKKVRETGKPDFLAEKVYFDDGSCRYFETDIFKIPIEDEKILLELAEAMLKQLGYKVLAANTPGDAISLAWGYAGEIHLLITDVVMPEMNGRELSGYLMSRYPALKSLFMSGYTANVIAHQGVLDEGMHFVQKPFSIKNLASSVREALE